MSKEKLTPPIKEYLKFYQEIGGEFMAGGSSSFLALRNSFSDLEEKIKNCQRCALYQSRHQAVPGEGNRQAELMFVGEAPGREEDLQGRPFVGKAGELLTKIIKAMTFTRDEVYITNVVKCRPPNNRTPQKKEIMACYPYLQEQIELIKPKVIVALGKVAANFFVPGETGIMKLRGRFYDFQGIPVMPTFHPAYLIRNEGDRTRKRMVWEDMQQVMKLLGRQ